MIEQKRTHDRISVALGGTQVKIVNNTNNNKILLNNKKNLLTT